MKLQVNEVQPNKDFNCTMRKFMLWLASATLFFTLITYNYYNPVESEFFFGSSKINSDIHPKGFLLDHPGCRIPDLDARDPHIASLIWDRAPLVCHAARPPLVRADLTSLHVVSANLEAYGLRDAAKLRCCYRELWRRNQTLEEDARKVDDSVRYSNSCVAFSSGPTRVAAEFVRVECRNGARKIYVDFFAFTPLKKQVEERCTEKDADFAGRDSLSVLIFGIDSVSRINFHRQMPETDNLLRRIGAIEMLGYNKIGDNTYPNVLAMLSGLTITEAQKICWSNDAPTFDTCPFVWHNFSRAGFRTAFAEDDAIIGTFNYNNRRGFVTSPTDYYMRPFHVTYNKAKGSKGEDHDGKLCLGSKANVDVLLNYTTSFATTMSSRRYFGLFWQSTVTHDKLNDAQQLDNRLATTLLNLETKGTLNNTVLIVMSDHGLRFGDIRKTFHGWLEERLPLLTFTFPQWFQRKYPEAIANLELNVKRLTTPFDLHRTLTDLLDLRGLTATAIRKRTETMEKRRDLSLFLPVSEKRTCDEADINVHWCTCQHSEAVSVYDRKIVEAAKFIVDRLNMNLASYSQCARLEVKSVVSARRQFVVGKDDPLVGDVEDFVVIVRVSPSEGLFEATVRQMGFSWEFANAEGLDVSRVNVYGNQSWCVDDAKMKLYCFCVVEHKGL